MTKVPLFYKKGVRHAQSVYGFAVKVWGFDMRQKSPHADCDADAVKIKVTPTLEHT